jgi:hypothetical protein
MIRIGCHHEFPLPQAEQVVLSHDPAHSLVVHCPSMLLQFRGDPRPAIAGELQGDALDLVPQIQIRVCLPPFRLEAI